ncbi:MAG TPA: helix-hairpin-helix domain-containing protein [Candidatus Sulfotelmatobacter sp.]|jgi:competence protein ComEA
MLLQNFRCYSALAVGCVLACATLACAPNQSPDQLREKTAQATAEVSRDAKAMAEGVKEGLSRDKTLNLNKASKDELLSLPGITEHEADRIVAERPFANTHDLVSRRIVPQEEFDKIKDRIIASR